MTPGDAALSKATEGVEKAQAALDTAIKERESVVKFWGDRVDRLRAAAASRADDVKQLKKQIADAKRQPKPPPPKTPK